MIEYCKTHPGNAGQDAFALDHGEAHLVEFWVQPLERNGQRYCAALASTYAEAKELKQQGGTYVGYIRLSDFWG